MRGQLQALATYCEERWVGKIGRQELSFGVSAEEALEVQAAGVRRPSRLSVEERRRVAQRLSEAAKTNEGDITSKGGGSGRRGLFGAD